MARTIVERLRNINPFSHNATPKELPQPLPADPSMRLVRVFVEGYDDVAFWRGIFDHFRNPYLRFEISVPNRADLPKGKKVLMSMIPNSSVELLLCVDSDFDYLFGNHTEQSREVNQARYMFHTYAYATENYLCYAPSLHNVCVKATKNDTRIFDFVTFMSEYSRIIYPIFLWYAYSAFRSSEAVFTLIDFKASVRLGFLDIADNGAKTLAWLRRNIAKREEMLRTHHPYMVKPMAEFEAKLRERGVTPETTYLYMQGHTLMDCVVLVMLNAVCEKLRQMSMAKISGSTKEGTALKNEMSNYTNSLLSIRDVLLDNENYTSCPLYKRLYRDIGKYLIRTILEMKKRGEIPNDSVLSIIHKLRQEE
ncbi:MAG: DUF4435 domain-containing protein [Alistipes sp.]